MALPTKHKEIEKFPELIDKLKIEEKNIKQTEIAVCPKCNGKFFFVINEPKRFRRKNAKSSFRYRFVCTKCGKEIFHWER